MMVGILSDSSRPRQLAVRAQPAALGTVDREHTWRFGSGGFIVNSARTIRPILTLLRRRTVTRFVPADRSRTGWWSSFAGVDVRASPLGVFVFRGELLDDRFPGGLGLFEEAAKERSAPSTSRARSEAIA